MSQTPDSSYIRNQILKKYSLCANCINRQINTIGFGPGNEELAHTTDEYVEVKQLHDACQVYSDLISIVDSQ